jgi:AcrR family transcriptional regulator
MPPRQQQRERVLARLADHLLATGLSQASLRELARVGGVSDRMLLYYFADKAEVLAGACGVIAQRVTHGLAATFPPGTRLSATEMMRAAAKLTTSGELRPFMRLWVEIVAAAARGEAPFVDIAATLLDGFLGWVGAHLVVSPGGDAEAEAALVVATVDGLALIDICRADDLVERAAARL